MPRAIIDKKLDTRTARGALKVSHEPYWRAIDRGMHIGYRKGKRKGSWIARFRSEDGAYRKSVLGLADDVQDANGVTVLNFSEAQAQARDWFAKLARIGESANGYSSGGRLRVSDILDDYLAWYEVHRRGIVQARSVVEKNIRPRLGVTTVDKLSVSKVRQFHEEIADTILAWKVARDPAADLATARRQSRATANRVLTVFKAAMNRAFLDGRILSDDAWRRVMPFTGANAPRVRYLTLKECKQLVDVCADDFAQLVRGALFTGCRYGALTKLTVDDFLVEHGKIFVELSKNGLSRYVTLSDEGQAFFTSLIKRRGGKSPMFVREGGRGWKKSEQARPLAEACRMAKINPAVSFHILRHTYASHLAMNNTPLAVIARQLGHSDTRMVERHYAHLATSYVDDMIRSGAPIYRI